MKLFIDIGGTNLRSELHTASEVLQEEILSQENDLIEVIESKLFAYPKISFIGVSFAGQVHNGEILSAPNLTIKEHKIKEYFESKYKNLRLEIDNDLKCAVRAEAEYFKSNSVLALYIGTGIGSALIDGGKLVRGVNNQAFEVGHIPYKKAPFLCGCGKDNCVELYASASGMKKWMEYYQNKGTAFAKQNVSSDMPKLFLSELENSDDIKKRELSSGFKDALLFATATLITLANPSKFVLGGGVIKRNTYLLEFLKENLEKHTFSNSLKDVEIVISELENGAMEGVKLLEEDTYA